MDFYLHPNLQNKIFILDLPLCRILLEDESHYPWIFLVPRRPNISRIMELQPEDQMQLLKELDFAQNLLWKEFQPDQLNVAALGNKTPQLHIHIIARQKNDPAWPHTVWEHPVRASYSIEQKERIVNLLKNAFSSIMV